MKNFKLPFFLFILELLFVATSNAELSDTLYRQFQTPPRDAQPWVFWVLTGEPTRESMTRDLEEMKAKGIAGCILYECQSGRGHNWWDRKFVLTNKDYITVPTDDYPNPYYTAVPSGKIATWTAPWRELVRFASKECGRLGISLVICEGLANTSGNISEEYGEQKLVWTETPVGGHQVFNGTLPEPSIREPKGDFPHPAGKNYRRDVAVLAIPDGEGFSSDKIIDLTTKMDAAGQLRWQAPEGNWKIIRFVQVPTYARNEWGYFNDSMSAEAMDQQWEVTLAPLLKEMTAEERRGLEGVEDDSWEAGESTWTKRFPEEFKKRRGYDLIPYLPIIAGVKMSDADTRARIRRDYALTVGDLIAENHYGHLSQLAAKNGLVLHAEAAGPNYDWADMLKTSGRVADAMAEFWMPSAHRPSMDSRFLLRNAANANHLYGKKITMCESFTSLGPEWEETPFDMKPVADQAFCDGLNKICVHCFSQSPSLTVKPGYVYVAGTHYEPGITWWDETPTFNTYLARCCALLQAGKFAADAVFYHGDNIGHGEQRKTILPTLGIGYDHDNCNSEVLLERMSVHDGRIALPDGMSYSVLVLPDPQPMPLDDLEKVSALIQAGATVVGPPPTTIAGKILRPGDGEKFRALAASLWDGLDGTNNTQKRIGAGRLIRGQTVREVLRNNGMPPDFEAAGVSDEGTIDWIHRRTPDAEIYFVASCWEHPEKINATFRVSGRQPELWDPVTGERRDATAFRQENGRTIVPLEFGPHGSIFVVFQKPTAAEAGGKMGSNYPALSVWAAVSGPWTVNFDPKWGGPEKVIFDQLIDWTNSPDPGVKYYSGKAVYHERFTAPDSLPQDRRVLLDLGKVEALASVRLNGHDLGVVWTQPARVDISGAVKAGENDLEITVVNLWPNRLIRDESLPKEQRLTDTNIHKFSPTSPLLSSGLIGPVNLLVERADENSR